MTLDTFFEKFDVFADAPDAVGKMRELILRLAMQGKLVSQNPRDKPAEVLVAELKAEASDKNGRRTAPLPPIAPDEIPFELPAGWVWERLGNIGETNIGLTYSPQDVSDVGTPVLRSSNVQKGKLDFDDLVRVTCEPKQSVMVQDGDLLICARNGSRALVGKVALIENLKEPAAFGAFMAIFRSRINTFLYHFICSPLFRRMIDEVNTTTINQITQNNLRSTLAPIPPLAEQKRIVAKVDELMALCDRLEAQQQAREQKHAALCRASLARFAEAPTPINLHFLFHNFYTITPAYLRKSILTLAVQGKLVPQNPNDEPAKEMLKRLAREMSPENRRRHAAPLPALDTESLQYEVPESWTWARFRDVAIIASNLVKPDDFLDFTHLAPDNIEKGNGVLLPCSTVREDKVISSNHRFYPGQIIYSKIRPNLAKVVVVDFEGLCSADMYPIDALIDTTYLQRYMLSESFLVQAVKTDTRVAMPKINQTELNALAVPVPPLAEQRRIVAKVEQLMALVDELEAQLAASRATATKLLSAIVAELTNPKESHAAVAV